MDLPPNYLSQLLNEGFGQNFAEYVNTYRVAAFKDKVTDPAYQHLTLLGLAYESGLGFAANAEYVRVPADGVIDWIPLALPCPDAATLCDGPLTSYHFLKSLTDVQPGQSVLIIGASGSLGTAAVQLARAFGARVTGVRSGRNAGLVRSLGADDVIDYTRTELSRVREPYDVVFDTIGTTSYRKSRHLLTATGRICGRWHLTTATATWLP